MHKNPIYSNGFDSIVCLLLNFNLETSQSLLLRIYFWGTKTALICLMTSNERSSLYRFIFPQQSLLQILPNTILNFLHHILTVSIEDLSFIFNQICKKFSLICNHFLNLIKNAIKIKLFIIVLINIVERISYLCYFSKLDCQIQN